MAGTSPAKTIKASAVDLHNRITFPGQPRAKAGIYTFPRLTGFGLCASAGMTIFRREARFSATC
jgi:hypothetical protein